MRKKSIFARRRGRRAGAIASLAVVAAMMVATVGAAPAQGATNTGWIPLRCALAGSIPVAVGAALTATVPDEVAPGDTFSVTGTTTLVLFPGTAQQSAAVFGADGLQGIVTIFETNLVNGSTDFQPTTATGSDPNSSPTQFDAVKAVQPPNQPAAGVQINGGDMTRGGFPGGTPPESFSFGDIPADTTGNTGNRYGPVPGTGGGPNPSDGTATTVPDIGPITVTGADGDTLTIKNINPGGPLIGAGINEPRIVQNTISFHQPAGTYTTQLPADCALDPRPEDTTIDEPGGDEVGDDGRVPKPVAEWVDQFDIPIVEDIGPVDGEGSTSARGTDSDADIAGTPGAASYSAITNCDEAQSTRPFYVRWGTNLFKKDAGAATASTCVTEGTTRVNEGSATGLVNGTTAATVEWSFVDGVPSPDNVNITVTAGSTVIDIAGAPEALNGSPGGVWTFETGDPWPAGGGA